MKKLIVIAGVMLLLLIARKKTEADKSIFWYIQMPI